MKRNLHLGLIFGILTTLFSCQAAVVSQLTVWLEPAEQGRICDTTPPESADESQRRWRPLREMRQIRASPLPASQAPPCPLTPISPSPRPQIAPSAEAPSPCRNKTLKTTVKILVVAPVSPSRWG